MKRTGNHVTVLICWALILCGILGIGTAIGQGGKQQASRIEEEEHISFALYGDMQNQQIAEEMAEVFQKQKHCRVDIYCYSTEEELKTNIIGQIAGGNSFDVFIISQEELPWLAEEGEILPLEGIVEKRGQEGESFYQTALSCGQTGGKQYAVPTGVMPYMIYYNRTLLLDAGLKDPQFLLEEGEWDFAGFAAYMEEIQEKTGQPGLTPLMDWEAYDVLQKRFAEGKLPMMIGALDMTRVCSGVDFSWDILPIPSDNNDFSNCSVGVSLLAVGDGKNAALAEEFADFYVSALGQKLRLQQGECVMPSLSMVFYTSMGDVVFPEHSNYYFFAIENGQADSSMGTSEEVKRQLEAIGKR